MHCEHIRKKLNAYMDGELPEKQRPIVEAHLASCESCRRQLEDIRGIDELFQGTLSVPPVPDGLVARIMAEARRKQPMGIPEKHSLLPVWNPLQWIAELSASMRLAACATVILALVAGLSLDGGQITGRNASIEPEKNLYGLEWFDPAPPDSIGSVYIAMATQTYQKGNRP